MRTPTFAVAAALLVLAACGSDKGSDAVTVNGDVPLAYVKRSTALRLNPTDSGSSAVGGDLIIREKSSPSAAEHNITAPFTQNQGDASGPEVSYDGRKLVFAMRCPASNPIQVDGKQACTGRWNIWEYAISDMTSGGLTGGSLRRLTSTTDADDVDPAYLPANRGFVFTSNRQATSSLKQATGQSYRALDEYERQQVFNLHTMDNSGANVRQISFNQSHDRNPVVRPNGDIMFSRWEHLADRNRFAIFRVKPDGTDMFVLYGAQSPGNSFLHPRDMDPNGRYKGFVASSLMPLSRTQEGGALMFIDAANYSENNTPANASIAAVGGQRAATAQALNSERGISTYGRITTPFPLWDGTDRVLLAYRPCEVTKNGQVVLCASLTSDELASLDDPTLTAEQLAAQPIQDNAPANYAIYMFDPARQTWLIVAAPPEGFMYTDPVALQSRAEPAAAQDTPIDSLLAAQGLALIEVRSVYDTDGLNRMAEQMLAAIDRPAGCGAGIATMKPTDPLETRPLVPDIVRMKDPADAAYGCAPARFVRAVRAVAPPSNSMGIRSAIGQTDFEQQQIVGYAPVEPDGSFKLQVPADTPLALAVIDSQGRAFQTHTNWIQVRPGERRTCDGCHSPRRGGALNSGTVVNSVPSALNKALSANHQLGETLASLRTRLDPSALTLAGDPVFSDIWADTGQPNVKAKASISLRYAGNADPADDLATPTPANGLINYPDHIQPLWTRPRGAAGVNTCTACHTDPAKLDLRGTTAGTGRLVSYEELLVGDPVIDPVTGKPVTRLEEGVPVVVRQPALVATSSGASNTAGQARKSRLTEILFGETLFASAEARTAHPLPPPTAPDHSTLLNRAEKRLIAEWMDLGGQYYNDPFANGSTVRTVSTLDQAGFTANVLPVLRASCASACHQAVGSDTSFRQNRYVLTGSADGDFGATLAMVSDTCQPAQNLLLGKPSTVPHPAGALTQITAVLPVGSAGYTAISSWISKGCSAR
jgi:Tol biopolymer transport system component